MVGKRGSHHRGKGIQADTRPVLWRRGRTATPCGRASPVAADGELQQWRVGGVEVTTAEDYESIAQEVYKTDPLIQKPPRRAGEGFFTGNDPAKQKWKVVNVSANVADGFQG